MSRIGSCYVAVATAKEVGAGAGVEPFFSGLLSSTSACELLIRRKCVVEVPFGVLVPWNTTRGHCVSPLPSPPTLLLAGLILQE